jgi:hypothetical protein
VAQGSKAHPIIPLWIVAPEARYIDQVDLCAFDELTTTLFTSAASALSSMKGEYGLVIHALDKSGLWRWTVDRKHREYLQDIYHTEHKGIKAAVHVTPKG